MKPVAPHTTMRLLAVTDGARRVRAVSAITTSLGSDIPNSAPLVSAVGAGLRKRNTPMDRPFNAEPHEPLRGAGHPAVRRILYVDPYLGPLAGHWATLARSFLRGGRALGLEVRLVGNT